MLIDKNSNIMILAPHIDDEIIGCAGTILKYRDNIDELSVVHFTSAHERLEEYRYISEVLNVNNHYVLSCEDGFVNVGIKDAVLSLIPLIQKEKPDIVFMPHKKDEHNDHKAVFTIGMDALEKSRYWECGLQEHKVTTIFLYEVWSFMHTVTEVIDISECFEEKIKLMSFYQSQMAFPYLDYIKALNGYRGILHNRAGMAEAFQRRSL